MRKNFRKAVNSRVAVLVVVFVLLVAVLLQRLFQLQIVRGESYQDDFTLMIMKERTLNSSRGNIYDRNGNPIAYNEISYCVTFEDNGTYPSTHVRNLSINGMLYRLIRLLKEQGDTIVDDFRIDLNANGVYEYNTSGFNLNRFKAD